MGRGTEPEYHECPAEIGTVGSYGYVCMDFPMVEQSELDKSS